MNKAPKAEIVIVGSELVSGAVADLNASFIVRRLLELGIRVDKISIVGDSEWSIEAAIDAALKTSDIHYIIVTGGLGSTADDVTSKAVAKATGTRLVISEEVLDHIRETMKARKKEMHPSQERQALIPQRAKILKNPVGTACGYILHHKGKVILLMPGVPGEMQSLMDDVVIPHHSEEFPGGVRLSSRLFHTFGLSETRIEEAISSELKGVGGLALSYLPSSSGVTVGVMAEGDEGARSVEAATDIVRERLGDFIFAEGEETMEERVGKLLQLRNKSLALAESCTGGAVGRKITNVPGSSSYFPLGVVAYSNEAKTRLLGVEPALIEAHGAVSAEVAAAMAQGARKIGHADYGLAVTGIAGPDGGTAEKPVGTVYFAISSESGTKYKGARFAGGRAEVREKSAQAALDLLRKTIIAE